MNDSDRLPGSVADVDSNQPISAQTLRKRQKRSVLIAIGVLLVLTPVMAVLFLIRPADLVILPEEAATSASAHTSSGVAWTTRDTVYLVSDNAVIFVSADGFYPVEHPVSKDQAIDGFLVRLEPLPGEVTLRIEPAGQHLVAIDLLPVDSSPNGEYELQLKRGTHIIDVNTPGYRPVRKEILVEGYGEPQVIAVSLVEDAAFLSYRIEPVDARVHLSGRLLPSIGDRIPISPGSYLLDLSAVGYVDLERPFQVVRDQHLDFGEISLQREPVYVSLSSDPTEATILIDGSYQGTTPLNLELTSGSNHHLVARLPDYEAVKMQLKGDAGTTLDRHIAFSKQPLQIEVEANVPTHLVVNGEVQGITPIANWTVFDGTEIVAQAAGYVEQVHTIDLIDGAKQTLNLFMLTKEEHAIRNSPDILTLNNGTTLKRFEPAMVVIPQSHSSWKVLDNEVGPDATVKVNVSRAFYLGQYEVTTGDYQKFDPSVPDSATDREPITNITWHEAAKYCNWLSDQHKLDRVYRFDSRGIYRGMNPEALGFRLPLEIEWVLANLGTSSADDVSTYPWGTSKTIPVGSDNLSGRERTKTGNENGNSLVTYTDNHVGKAPVGTYLANRSGLFDLNGNVSEWMHDLFATFPHREDLSDYMGPAQGLEHVVRGANFNSYRWNELMVSARGSQNAPREDLGFRVAKWLY